MNSVHSRIKQRREELGLSMKELAELVGVSAWQTIQQWERETGGTAPKRDRLQAVASALRTTPEFLIFGPAQSPVGSDVVNFSLTGQSGQSRGLPSDQKNTATKVAAAFESLSQVQRESVIAALRAFGAWD